MAAPRIGLLGGAFDPPHRAHVALAESAVQALHLDHLLVLPTGQSWHRSGAGSAGDHRLAMARLAFADVARTQVLDLELTGRARVTPSTRCAICRHNGRAMTGT